MLVIIFYRNLQYIKLHRTGDNRAVRLYFVGHILPKARPRPCIMPAGWDNDLCIALCKDSIPPFTRFINSDTRQICRLAFVCFFRGQRKSPGPRPEDSPIPSTILPYLHRATLRARQYLLQIPHPARGRFRCNAAHCRIRVCGGIFCALCCRPHP